MRPFSPRVSNNSCMYENDSITIVVEQCNASLSLSLYIYIYICIKPLYHQFTLVDLFLQLLPSPPPPPSTR